MGLFSRNSTDGPEAAGDDGTHVYSIPSVIQGLTEDAELANPDLSLRVRPDVPTTAEVIAAKEAGRPIDTVKFVCGACGVEMPRSEQDGHVCVLTPRQQDRKERGKKQVQAIMRATQATGEPCFNCAKWIGPGDTHWCAANKELLPHDAAALAYQQAGLRASLGLQDLESTDDSA